MGLLMPRTYSTPPEGFVNVIEETLGSTPRTPPSCWVSVRVCVRASPVPPVVFIVTLPVRNLTELLAV